MKLKYSSVQQPELVGYLALLNPENLEIEQVAGYCDASLRTADQVISDRKTIALEVARLCGNSLLSAATSKRSAEEEAKFEQVFSFAYGTVEPSCASNHPDMFTVLEMLNEMLVKTCFLIGNDLSAADALVFSLLHSRIRALIPLNQRKYFRVLRWFLQVQHEVAKTLTSIFVPGAFDLKASESASTGVPEVAMEKLSLEEAKERKKQQKGKKPEEAVAAVNVPIIGRVDLRVGKIVEIEKHPNADRLYIEKVDFGETELRTVVSGLVEHVPIEDLKDRLCMFICNLKPASICKVQSTAMLLVAKNDTQGLEPLIIPAGARPGDRVCVAGVEAQPDAVIKPAKEPQMSVWDEVRKDLAVDGQGIAKYKDQVLVVAMLAEPIHSLKVANGLIG